MGKKRGKQFSEKTASSLSKEERELFLSAFYQGIIPKKAPESSHKGDSDKKSSAAKPNSRDADQNETSTRAVNEDDGTKAPLESSLDAKDEAMKEISESDRDLFLRTVEDGGIFDQPHDPYEVATKSSRRSKKRNEIDGSIDLHGLYAEDAVHRLLRFLDDSQRIGHRRVLVIHGKGEGVLKSAVWSVIESHPLVESFQVAPGRLGGEGAILLRLQRSRKRRTSG